MNVKSKKLLISLINLIFIYVLFGVDEVRCTHEYKREGEELLKRPLGLDQRNEDEHQSPEFRRQFRKVIAKAMDTNREVDAGAVARKVWSKWSKWGECSASCGYGAKTRQRLCLGGRCAPGEREEQQIPCNREPCNLRP